MSGTITTTFTASISNGSFSDSISIRSDSVTQNAVGQTAGILSIGTSEETISQGDVSSAGYCFVKNHDSTNFVVLGPDSGGSLVPMLKLKAGEYAWFRLYPGLTLKAQADTAAVKLEVRIYED